MARSWDKNLGRRERRYHHVRPPLIIGLAPGRPVGLTLRMLGVIAARGVLQYILVSLGCGEGYGLLYHLCRREDEFDQEGAVSSRGSRAFIGRPLSNISVKTARPWQVG